MGQRANPKPELLAAKLIMLRQQSGCGQNSWAGLMSMYGAPIRSNRISEFELGKRVPNLILLLLYARLSGVNLEYILDDNYDLELFKLRVELSEKERDELMA